MKNLFLAFLLLAAFSTSAQTFHFDGPLTAGSNVIVTVNDVPEEGEHYLAYYGFDGTEIVASDAGELPADEPGTMKGAIVIHPHMSWVRVVLVDQYFSPVAGHDEMVKNESAHPKAGKLEKALALASYARQLGMDRDAEMATALFRKAIEEKPEWMNEPAVLSGYFYQAKAAKAQADMDKVNAFITDLSKNAKGKEEKLLTSAYYILNNQKDSVQLSALRKQIDKHYPKSSLAQWDMLQSFRDAEELAAQLKIRDKFIRTFAVTKDNDHLFDEMSSTIAAAYIDDGDWSKAEEYLRQINDPGEQASDFNNHAWTLSGESIEAKAINLDLAEKWSARSLKLIDETTPGGYETEKQLEINRGYDRAMYGDTYALIRFKQGHVHEALDHQSFAAKQYGYSNGEMNERLIEYLYTQRLDNRLGQSLIQYMDQFIAEGNATPRIREIHKQYWMEDAPKEGAYQQYLSLLEAKAWEKLTNDIKKKWEDDMDASAFMLKDLDGNDVSLADYKGKVVVLDFWATWCGPCRSSFPGMKKAIEHFQTDDKVAFLFVDTWEGGEGAHEKVSKFISDNNYPFHVLMDSENKVVADYKVEGIPTKFVIGPDQKIRFISRGWGGDTDELVKELKIMIALAKGSGGDMSKS